MIMIGKQTSKKLRDMNINTLYDLYLQTPEFLEHKFGVVGRYLHNAVSGIDDDKLTIPNDENTKSVGNGSTSVKDMTTLEEVQDFLHDLSSKVSRRLRCHNFSAKTVHISVRFADLTYKSTQTSKSFYFNNEQDLYNVCLEMFLNLIGETFPPIRGIRICTSNLTNNNEQQMNLFENVKNTGLCYAIDHLKEKYGDEIIGFAKDYKEFK